MIIDYIAHPISGDIEENLKKIRQIVRHINLTEPDIVPFVPYYVDIVSMDDNNPVERERGIKNDTHILKIGIVNRIRLYGDRISKGMENEVLLCLTLGITVLPMTKETQKEYETILKSITTK